MVRHNYVFAVRAVVSREGVACETIRAVAQLYICTCGVCTSRGSVYPSLVQRAVMANLMTVQNRYSGFTNLVN